MVIIMNKIPKITEAEYEVMNILWESEFPLTSVEIIKKLETQKGWNKSTTLTLIGRLVEKEAITSVKKEGRAYCYSPLIFRDDYIKSENDSFIKKLYGGKAKNLIASLVETQKLSNQDIDELKEILKKSKNRNKTK